MTLGEALVSERSANLDVLRLVLAVSVIVSHAWPLALGPGTPEPLEGLTGHSLGGWAVAMFFCLSGLLIARSAERNTARVFWIARARRILPGLSVALLLSLGLAIASGATADLWDAVNWYARAFTFVSIEHRLSGAYASNPYPEVVNGPLWSLFHEIAAYAVCALLVRAGLLRSPIAMLVFLAAAGLLVLSGSTLPGRVATFAPLFAAFASGMGLYVFRNTLRLNPYAALILLPLTVLAPWPVAIGAIAYAAVTFALYLPALRITNDFSYGLYIYGWPIAQSIVHSQPGIGPGALAFCSVLATLPFAFISWYYVERPGLLLRRAVV
jgi:peptidoglycan/LPS O-acetylase OafA/YrhL